MALSKDPAGSTTTLVTTISSTSDRWINGNYIPRRSPPSNRSTPRVARVVVARSPRRHQCEHALRGLGHRRLHERQFVGLEAGEHVIGHVGLVLGAADADLHAADVGSAEGLDD